MVRTICLAIAAAALAGCAHMAPQATAVTVIGIQHDAPKCQELGLVSLSGTSAQWASSMSGNPQDETIRLLAAAKGADTVHYVKVFPLTAMAYRCHASSATGSSGST